MKYFSQTETPFQDNISRIYLFQDSGQPSNFVDQ